MKKRKKTVWVLRPQNGTASSHQLIRRALLWAHKMVPVWGPWFSAGCSFFGTPTTGFTGALQALVRGQLEGNEVRLGALVPWLEAHVSRFGGSDGASEKHSKGQ